ncbi:hypothetical protein HAX54_051953 [Datura stramonium]|uniref:Uncharacterized protein n=1 Tax=Datura stramonium TaxID=4076 RepID=A0ABS8T037_DATST|nr:hypothetical protein [Datura stramonium]
MARGKMEMAWTKEIVVGMSAVARQWYSGRQMQLGDSAGRGRGVGVKCKKLAPRLGTQALARMAACARAPRMCWRTWLLTRAHRACAGAHAGRHMAQAVGQFSCATTSVGRPLVVNGQGWHVSINDRLCLRRIRRGQ